MSKEGQLIFDDSSLEEVLENTKVKMSGKINISSLTKWLKTGLSSIFSKKSKEEPKNLFANSLNAENLGADQYIRTKTEESEKAVSSRSITTALNQGLEL